MSIWDVQGDGFITTSSETITTSSWLIGVERIGVYYKTIK